MKNKLLSILRDSRFYLIIGGVILVCMGCLMMSKCSVSIDVDVSIQSGQEYLTPTPNRAPIVPVVWPD